MARGRKKDLESSAKLMPVHGEIPPAPDWLPTYADKEWNRVAPILMERGHLTPGVLATLESYCVAVAMVRSASMNLQIDGNSIDTPRGPIMNPEFRILTQGQRDVRLLAAELGLTPFRHRADAEQHRDDRAAAGNENADLYA